MELKPEQISQKQEKVKLKTKRTNPTALWWLPFLSAGRLHRLCGIHRCHQPAAEGRNQSEAQVVFQIVWSRRQREDRQRGTGDHLLGKNVPAVWVDHLAIAESKKINFLLKLIHQHFLNLKYFPIKKSKSRPSSWVNSLQICSSAVTENTQMD